MKYTVTRREFLIRSGVASAMLFSSAHAVASEAVLKGFNQNWSVLPSLKTPGLVEAIKSLKPAMLRYPGGTVTHSWDWQAGSIKTRKTATSHRLENVAELKTKSGSELIIVLDVVNRTLADQLQMLNELQSLGVNISHIELGNELYAQEDSYIEKFATGADYARLFTEWASTLKKNFPNAKLGAVLLGRPVGERNRRSVTWNEQVVPGCSNVADAFIYHVYINENETAASTIERFKRVAEKAKTGSKDLWITEYGNKHPAGTPEHGRELIKLAKFLENYPHVKIVLNHQLIGGEMPKISPDMSLTREGELYLSRNW
jgi:hypothetical protein